MVEPHKNPWPSDALMIVAANKGEENRRNMPKGVMAATCCECGQELAASVATFEIAEVHPDRHERPIRYFCIACATDRYDFRTIQSFMDHRERSAVR